MNRIDRTKRRKGISDEYEGTSKMPFQFFLINPYRSTFQILVIL